MQCRQVIPAIPRLPIFNDTSDLRLQSTDLKRVSMKSMTRDEQLRILCQLADGALLRHLPTAALLITLILVALGCKTGQPPYFMVAMLSVALGTAAWFGAPHLRNAAKGWRSGWSSEAEAEIEPVADSDSPERYQVRVMDGYTRWTFEFIASGWEPPLGRVAVTVFRISEVAWPVLLVTPNGLLVPRCSPRKCLYPNPAAAPAGATGDAKHRVDVDHLP